MAALAPSPLTPLFGGVAAVFGALAFAAQALAQDPPDFDYITASTVDARPLAADVLAELEGPDDFADIASDLHVGAATILAAVRAYERAQGASLAGDPHYALARSDEAIKHARRASARLRAASPATRELGEYVGDERADRFPRVQFVIEPAQLRPEALAFLYRAGFSIDHLRRAMRVSAQLARQSDGATSMSGALFDASDELESLGTELQRWVPDLPG
jgi:hypothetical protein